MEEIRDKKAIRHMKHKQENDRNKYFIISNSFNCKCIKLSSQKTDWQIGEKNIYLLAVHKKLTSEPKT